MKRKFGYNNTSNKFGAHKVRFKDMEFDSRYEMQRYLILRDLQKKGHIDWIWRQKRFKIIKKVVKLVPVQLKTKVRYDQRVVEQEAWYTCDFMYEANGIIYVEEVKSVMTAELPDYVLRRKLMVNKIYDHNEKPNRKKWMFREVVYDKDGKVTITEK